MTNPAANTVALTGVAFTDNLPAGLAVTSLSKVESSAFRFLAANRRSP
jgi:uncharacterized repeat protein (TIGR01451 family)